MKVNFNNEKEVELRAVSSIPGFVKQVEERITGNQEHFWLEYKQDKKSIEQKWHRTDFSDKEILDGVKDFISKGFPKNAKRK